MHDPKAWSLKLRLATAPGDTALSSRIRMAVERASKDGLSFVRFEVLTERRDEACRLIRACGVTTCILEAPALSPGTRRVLTFSIPPGAR